MNETIFRGQPSGGSSEGDNSSDTSSARKVFDTLIRQIHERRALAGKQVMATDHETEVMSDTELSCVTFNDSKTQVDILESVLPRESFTVFPKLPLELRRRIWYYALPDSRVIEIEWTASNAPKAGWFYTIESIHRTPIVYRINKEARRESLRFYKPITLNAANFPVSQFPEERITRPKQYEIPFTPIHFFDARVDVLFFSIGDCHNRLYERQVKHLNTDLLKDVRFIAVIFEHFLSVDFYRGPPTISP
ncbi:hypothetical protein N431DRAFT_471391 [Stipitochalara longipes BDJ]|nr:hypothetical protein N431DRAFT_471391 [Stipitochalara longipes BDJ]